MKLRDLLKLGIAKWRDFRSNITPKGYFEESTRIYSRLKNKDPASDEFAKSFEALWIFTWRTAKYFESVGSVVEATYSRDETLKPEDDRLLDDIRTSVRRFRQISDIITQARRDYYLWREGHQDYQTFESSLKRALTLKNSNGGFENGN